MSRNKTKPSSYNCAHKGTKKKPIRAVEGKCGVSGTSRWFSTLSLKDGLFLINVWKALHDLWSSDYWPF